MPTAIRIAVCTSLLLGSGVAVAAGDGLTADAARVPWARAGVQDPVTVDMPAWRSALSEADRTGLKLGSTGLLGDHYFRYARSADAYRQGGFRATGGLLRIDRRGRLEATDPAAANDNRLTDPTTAAYLGVGYSSLASQGGWSFSADLGVMALKPGSAVRFGRSLGNNQSVDDALREMRLAPVLQLGVSYAF